MRQGARIWVILGLFGVAAVIAFLILTAHVHILQMAAGVMLAVFATSMLYIGWVLYFGRYTDPTDQPDAEAEVGPEHVFPPSWAPPLLALGVALCALGVRFTPVLLAVGGIIVVLTLFSWIVQRVDVMRMLHTTLDAELADPPPGVGPGEPGPGTPELGSPRIGHDNA
ncbi:MAG TPA: cytochrome c oxidase subunit 4 [Mycobacterium sp.]|nr:cytochrome c oxidase subunit 4 [Mycobacterium sp.]